MARRISSRGTSATSAASVRSYIRFSMVHPVVETHTSCTLPNKYEAREARLFPTKWKKSGPGASVQLQNPTNHLVPLQARVRQEPSFGIDQDRAQFPDRFPFPGPDPDLRAIVRSENLDQLIAFRDEHLHRPPETGVLSIQLQHRLLPFPDRVEASSAVRTELRRTRRGHDRRFARLDQNPELPLLRDRAKPMTLPVRTENRIVGLVVEL